MRLPPKKVYVIIICIYGAQGGGFLECFVNKTGKTTNERKWKNECSERSRKMKQDQEKKNQSNDQFSYNLLKHEATRIHCMKRSVTMPILNVLII